MRWLIVAIVALATVAHAAPRTVRGVVLVARMPTPIAFCEPSVAVGLHASNCSAASPNGRATCM